MLSHKDRPFSARSDKTYESIAESCRNSPHFERPTSFGSSSFDNSTEQNQPGSNPGLDWFNYVTNSFNPRAVALEKAKFVVHSTTMNFPSMIDTNYFRDRNRKDYSINEHKSAYGCSTPKCMHKNDSGDRTELIRSKCPCLDYDLAPICFYEFLKFAGSFMFDRPTRRDLNQMKQTAFCFDHCSLFSEKYEHPIRGIGRPQGWTSGQAHFRPKDYLELLYWYRKYPREKKEEIQNMLGSCTDPFSVIYHAICTMDSIFGKFYIAFPDYGWDYTESAAWMRQIFEGLIENYSNHRSSCKTYLQWKEFSSHTKQYFMKMEQSDRMRVFDPPLHDKESYKIIQTILLELKGRVIGGYALDGHDHTDTMAFAYRCAILAQTRGFGYLPEGLAERSRKEYRSIVTQKAVTNPLLIQLVNKYIEKFLEKNGIERNLYNNRDSDQLKKGLEMIHTKLERTASLQTPVHKGGKLQDGQTLLERFRGRKLPIRDLDTLEVQSWFFPGMSTEDIARDLFWISFQIVLNFFSTEKKRLSRNYFFEMDGLEKALNDMYVIHLDEPGKLRVLSKTRSELYFFLSPISKFLQGVLAEVPSMRAGLIGAGQAWSHYRRVSACDEFYDTNGCLRKTVRNLSTDFRTATDFLRRDLAANIFRTFGNYVGFPRGYLSLACQLIQEPNQTEEMIPSYEVSKVTNFYCQAHVEKVQYRSFRGVPMGTSPAKVILTLIHAAEQIAAEEFCLKHYGVILTQIRPNVLPPLKGLKQHFLAEKEELEEIWDFSTGIPFPDFKI